MTHANIIATTNKDMQRAAFMVSKSNAEINPIFLGAKLAMLQELERRMSNGETITFEYLKKSTGEIRRAIGCRYSALIAPQIKGTGTPNAFYGNFTYFDLERNAFRCCSYETILRIVK